MKSESYKHRYRSALEKIAFSPPPTDGRWEEWALLLRDHAAIAISLGLVKALKDQDTLRKIERIVDDMLDEVEKSGLTVEWKSIEEMIATFIAENVAKG